ncbi:MAG: shikimate dehydrogenase [Chloroflexota bacterium]|nr:shikimate dehydrogenase [Chloroflexota bacterium]
MTPTTPHLRLGVIGYPIRHSISPAFQQAALDEYGIGATYERYEVAPENLSSFVDLVRGEEWLGINVTIPHKQATIPLLDEVEPVAAVIGSVNTVLRKPNGSLWGTTTDPWGFANALAEHGYKFEGSRAVVLGTGGTARAVVAALLDRRVVGITAVGRSVARAGELTVRLAPLRSDSQYLRPMAWDAPELSSALREAQLLTNTTPVGMLGGGAEGVLPVAPHLLHAGLTVFDAVYNPMETPLLIAAGDVGAQTVGGLDMLVHQGAAAFALWTGREAPIEIMRKTAREAMEG